MPPSRTCLRTRERSWNRQAHSQSPAPKLGLPRLPRPVAKRPTGAIVAVATGANMNFDRLRHVSERAEIGEKREAVYAVTIPEKPGALKEFCACVGTHSITEFNYRYAGPERARVFLGLTVARTRSGRRDGKTFSVSRFRDDDLSGD